MIFPSFSRLTALPAAMLTPVVAPYSVLVSIGTMETDSVVVLKLNLSDCINYRRIDEKVNSVPSAFGKKSASVVYRFGTRLEKRLEISAT